MSVGWRWFGRQPYAEMLAWQRARRGAVIAGEAPEILALVEHPRVVTTGRRDPGDLSGVRAAGIPVVPTERGGLATWHGPGQIVGYPIVDVGERGIGVKRFVRLLEDLLVDTLAGEAIAAERRPGFPGVWVAGRKIASIGLHFSRGVSMHGFALNVDADLEDFDRFTACGIDGVELTSTRGQGSRASIQAFVAPLALGFATAVDTATRRHYNPRVP